MGRWRYVDTFNRNFIVLGPGIMGNGLRGKGRKAWVALLLGAIRRSGSRSSRRNGLTTGCAGSGMVALMKQIVSRRVRMFGKRIVRGRPGRLSCRICMRGFAERLLSAPGAGTSGSVTYVSDPLQPVPYRPQPIEATYGKGKSLANLACG